MPLLLKLYAIESQLGCVMLSASEACFEKTINALNCGSLLTHGDYWDADKTVGQQEIRCFVQAHQQCKAATLFETSQGTDISEEYTFRTANGLAGCAISVIGYEKGMCINRFGPFYCLLAPSIDSACTTMQQEHDGLRFLHCGNVQDIPFLI